MNHNQLYPFERNRYYAGKMLTSADFQAEQSYFMNKNCFMNALMYGSGIVCGLGVFSLDDLSILVESGVAIDGLGREIVVDSSVVKKLSSIDGFEQLAGNKASLCLKYVEKPVHSVYAVNKAGTDQEYEFNRVSEGYQLFLLDTADIMEEFVMETEFLTSGILYMDTDFMVEAVMPSVASKGKAVKLVVKVTKLSNDDVKLTYHGVLQAPAFTTVDQGHEIDIDLEDIILTEGEVLCKEYWMVAQDMVTLDTNILLKSGSVHAYVDDKAVPCSTDFALKLVIENVDPRTLVNRQIGRMSLEMKNVGGMRDFIRLADLELVRTENAYIIEKVFEQNIKSYINAPSQENTRAEYLDYYIKHASVLEKASKSTSVADRGAKESTVGEMPQIATGLLEIPLSENARRGDVCFSGEIMHGLGKGNVYVQVGYEYIAEDASLSASAKNTIYGNSQLFENEKVPLVQAETAVKVLNDKGSFVVAAKLQENVDFLTLTYRWVAIKFPAGNDMVETEDVADQSISAETPTVVLGTKESHFFGVQYNNMPKCSVTYELTENGSGEITSDGVYTAPSKEGVYEIRIYCTDMPIICTYAYAIVKKTGYESEEE